VLHLHARMYLICQYFHPKRKGVARQNRDLAWEWLSTDQIRHDPEKQRRVYLLSDLTSGSFFAWSLDSIDTERDGFPTAGSYL
jgi:hypothetical protein